MKVSKGKETKPKLFPKYATKTPFYEMRRVLERRGVEEGWTRCMTQGLEEGEGKNRKDGTVHGASNGGKNYEGERFDIH